MAAIRRMRAALIVGALVTVGVLLGVTPASAYDISIDNVRFYIPATRDDVIASPITSGSNTPINSPDSFFLGPQSSTTGSLRFTLDFSAQLDALYPPNGAVELSSGALTVSFSDLDILPDVITTDVVLTEVCIITADGTVEVILDTSDAGAPPYTPPGATDNTPIAFENIPLSSTVLAMIEDGDFMLDFYLTATLVNDTDSRGISLRNTVESVGVVGLDLEPVPEPSTIVLLLSGIGGIIARVSLRKGKD
jgi:hypothetical protein